MNRVPPALLLIIFDSKGLPTSVLLSKHSVACWLRWISAAVTFLIRMLITSPRGKGEGGQRAGKRQCAHVFKKNLDYVVRGGVGKEGGQRAGRPQCAHFF